MFSIIIIIIIIRIVHMDAPHNFITRISGVLGGGGERTLRKKHGLYGRAGG